MQGAILKSFTYDGTGGNGAGVIICDSPLADERMQSVAAEVGLSETAFVTPAGDGVYDLRFFTPLCEVDLCGHATIAAFYYMGEIGMIQAAKDPVRVVQNTKAGKLEIDVYFEGCKVAYVLMQQVKPQIFGEITPKRKLHIAESLNMDIADIGLCDYDIEPSVVSTGLRDVMIPVKSIEKLNSIIPTYEKISQVSEELHVTGYHVYTIEGKKVHARNFAPLVGIPEECATGTSNGALGGLLSANGLIDGYMEVIQGEAMQEPSLICVRVDGQDVRVGGKASVVKKIY